MGALSSGSYAGPISEDDGFVAQLCDLKVKLEHLAHDASQLANLRRQEKTPPDFKLIRCILNLRAKRRKLLNSRLFGEPAWDMLLELYYSDLCSRTDTVSDLCIASGAPSTTALRWLHALEYEGLLRRKADPTDRRRFFVRLTAKARDTLNELFVSSDLSTSI
jgi:DNA-binding MarR family transcriptional regulator